MLLHEFSFLIKCLLFQPNIPNHLKISRNFICILHLLAQLSTPTAEEHNSLSQCREFEIR